MTRRQQKGDMGKAADASTRQAQGHAAAPRRGESPATFKLRDGGPGAVAIEVDHPDEEQRRALAMQALGASEPDFLDPFIGQIVYAASKGQTVDISASGFALAVVKGVAPRDQVEAMLAAQMAAVHLATMSFARRLNHVETIPQQDSAERGFNKLARTFATQVEALKRYRTGGEQKVTVQHVTVNDGGQAVVGNVRHGGRGNEEK